MKVKIIETGVVEELDFFDEMTGIDMAYKFIEKYEGFSDGQFIELTEEGLFSASQATYSWWKKVLTERKLQNQRISELVKKHGKEVVEDILREVDFKVPSDIELLNQSIAVNEILLDWNWALTNEHLLNKNRTIRAISPTGRVYSLTNEPGEYSQSDLAKALGVSTAAIRDRIRRGTLPNYDRYTTSGRGYWNSDTVKHLL